MPEPLTGLRKAALVLVNLDKETAAHLMQQFSEDEAEKIAAEILQLKGVDAAVANEALDEFYALGQDGSAKTRGGRDVAASILEASFGSERAAGLLSRVASSLAGRAFEFLEKADASHVALLLDGELPQTTALVLAHLRPDAASQVLGKLTAEQRTSVTECLATMNTASPEAIRVIADTLRARAGAVVTTKGQVDAVGGVQSVVDIINRSDVATEKAILDDLEQRDPDLAQDIRSRMLTFADIVKLDSRDVQQVLRGIDIAVLALAMKGSPQTVQDLIRENLTERNRVNLEEEQETLGAVKVSKVEEARSEVVRAIRTLEAEGAITVQRGDAEELVE
ncbi:flagellar motor switch protein FliG [Curtobacterium sp. MCBD17_040]|uniref:flagellar motor switch protein FliG n=1 Tax=Curtobacterium sp. MCBD17_040 TaxID=2175674 RepID=UPI000DA8785F|nr:flagellar motor switch protein FliG [Curtobacterium sp. MCBD17_040]WIB65576.1 flagellar motor switch protein FliG [Curtobacterium sp. MCBD17_040]